MKTIGIYLIGWAGLVVLAILNGSIRQFGYSGLMTELSAHQLSTLIFILLIAAYTWFLSGAVRPESAGQALLIGLIWLCLTVLFEFGFGHYVAGHSWEKLFHDYNLLQGRLWLLVLVWTMLAPFTMFRLRS